METNKNNLKLKQIILDNKINRIEQIVNDCSNMFYYPVEDQQKLRLEAIKTAFSFHYNNNAFYRSLCQKANLTPNDIQSYNDLRLIPLIPIELFNDEKSNAMMSLPLEYKQLELHLSGRSGSHVVAYRDSVSNELAITTISLLFIEMLDMRFHASPIVVYFTPSIVSAPNLGMLRGMGIMGGIYADRFFVVENEDFKFKETTEYIRQWVDKLPIYFVGPPFIINFYIEYLKANNIHLELSENGRIVTIGGWKRHTGDMIIREDFTRKCCNQLGITPDQCRDIYGFIETNQMSIECNKGKKHIPPFIEMYACDLHDISSFVKTETEGAIALLDPTIITYPGFILTRDVGIIRKDILCDCGRKGDIVEIIGRVKRSEDINCAITLDQYLSGVTDTINHGYK